MSATRTGTSSVVVAGSYFHTGGSGAVLTSASTITVTDSFHEISGSTTINTINGGQPGMGLFLYRPVGATWVLGTSGNVNAGDDLTEKRITMLVTSDGNTWYGQADQHSGVFPTNGLTVGTTQLVCASGNVGIGTATPGSYKLNVNGSTKIGDGVNTLAMTGVAPILAITSAANNTGVTVRRDGYAEIGMQSAGLGYLGTYTNHYLQFFTNGLANPRMTIDTTGKVGIGTAAPISTSKVDIEKTRSATPGEVALAFGSTSKWGLRDDTNNYLNLDYYNGATWSAPIIITGAGAIHERSRTVAMGEWTTPTFAAGNFTASGTMAWTVAAGDVLAYRYTLVGKMMTLSFYINTTTVVAPLSTVLKIAIPGGYTAYTHGYNLCFVSDNGTRTTGIVGVDPSGTTINISLLSGAAFSAATDTTTVLGQLTFEVA